MRRFLCLSPLILLLSVTTLLAGEQKPALMLANVYHTNVTVKEYWVSEKLDGVRAYWNGGQLLTRQGNPIPAPHWFLQQLPEGLELDGELWTGRGGFETISSIVRKQRPVDQEWRSVSYCVFDLPGMEASFDQRIEAMNRLIANPGTANLRVVKQFKVDTHDALMQSLQHYVALGAEGLMLHRGASYYRAGRSDDLLKLKPYRDAEARVVKHYPGQGKYQGMMGSILVEDENGKRFRIGSGFTDEERRSPPPVGAIITFAYNGRTENGIPRFARFLRLRLPE